MLTMLYFDDIESEKINYKLSIMVAISKFFGLLVDEQLHLPDMQFCGV